MTDLFEQLARAFVGVETHAAVYRSTVSVAHETVEPDVTLVVREHLGDLVRIARASNGDHDVASVLPGDSVPGTSLSLGQPCLVDDQDVFRGDVPASAKTPLSGYRSLVAVPFGDGAVLVVCAVAPGAFDDADFERVADVAAFADAALDRVDADAALPDDHLEQVAAVLSHDVTNVLGVIDGNLSLLPEAEEREDIAAVYRGLRRLEQLIDDVVTVLRSGETELDVGAVDLDRVARDCWELVEDGRTDLIYGDLPVVLADESRLRQVFENLLRNAVEHTDADGTVWVGTMDDGTGVYVEDDGPGIPPERRERVFDYGYSGSEESSGFGLSIVTWIADAHGWDVRATEADLGGARFEITGLELEHA